MPDKYYTNDGFYLDFRSGAASDNDDGHDTKFVHICCSDGLCHQRIPASVQGARDMLTLSTRLSTMVVLELCALRLSFRCVFRRADLRLPDIFKTVAAAEHEVRPATHY